MRAGGGLKFTAGALGIAGGIALFTMATGGVGLLLAPVAVMAILHAGGTLAEGASELATGRDEVNAVEELYARIGGEKGRTVYQVVDWSLTAVDGAIVVNGLAKGGAKLAAQGTAKAAAKMAWKHADDGARILTDLANKTDLPGQLYEQSGLKRQEVGK